MPEEINVCVISPDFVPVWSGIGAYVISLLQNFPREVQVHLVTVRRTIPGGLRDKIGNSSNQLLDELKHRAELHFISEAKDTFFYHLKFQSACSSFVPSLCKEKKIDLIHSNFPLMSDIQVKLLRRLRIPTVATVHSTIEGQHFGVKASNMAFSRMQTSDKANLLLNYPLKICEFVYSRKIDYFMAVSEYIKREMQSSLMVEADKIKTIHNGVNVDRFRPDAKDKAIASHIPPDRPVVLFTGRFAATKGIDTIIRAIPRIVQAFPKAFFLFVGGGDYAPYQSYLKNEGIDQGNYWFRGYVSESELPGVYSNSSIYLAPTIYDPFPMRVLEAMSCGLPVIASRTGGIPEMITDGRNGFLIAPNDSYALSDRVIELLNDSKLTRLFGCNAREAVVREFSDKKMAEKTASFYRQVLNGK